MYNNSKYAESQLRDSHAYDLLVEQALTEALEICRGCVYLLPDEDGPYCMKLRGPVPEKQEQCPRVQKYPEICRSCEALIICTDEEIERDHVECEREASN